MSALGQKRTLGHVRAMSALPPKADIGTQPRDVRFVPQTDSCTAANSDATRSPHRHGQGALVDIRAGAGENSAQCLILARTRAKHCTEPSLVRSLVNLLREKNNTQSARHNELPVLTVLHR